MDATTRAALIDRYRDGIREVHAALATVAPRDLDTRPADGGWSVRRVVHHLADSEMTSAIRLRRLLVEDHPEIGAYDEEAFAEQLHYDARPLGNSIKAFEAARETTLELLERLTEADWTRTGTHPEHGGYSVETWLELYAAHGHDHADQIRAAAAEAAG